MIALPDVLKDWKESAATMQLTASVKWADEAPTSARTSKGMMEPRKELPSNTFLTLVILKPTNSDKDGPQKMTRDNKTADKP